MKRYLLHIFLFFYSFCLSQKDVHLFYLNSDYQGVKKRIHTAFKDSSQALAYTKELKQLAISKGYLLASNDSLFFQEKTLYVKFYLGPKFKKAVLRIAEEDMKFLKLNTNLTEKMIRKVAFNPREINQILTQTLHSFENNGYPFCKVYLDSLSIFDNILEAEIKIERQNNYRISKINLVGNPIISEKMVSTYIQIKKGDVFNQEKINEISSKLKFIPFVNELKPVELLFTPEGVEIFLYLQAKPVSLANGVVGLQPNTVTNKVSLTGELRLKLVNTLKKAELFELNWRSIQAQTSSLKLAANIPNLIQTPFGFDGQFQMYRRDSTFLELKSTLGIQYALKQGNYLKAFYRRNSSNVLYGGKNNTSFDNLKSVETNFYGLALAKQTIDYLPSPRKGIQFLLEATIGSRKTLDSLNVKKETTFKFEIQINYYLPLGKRHILKLANFTESYFAPSYYQNEVFRFGGQISLRGFNEEQLYATSRSVSTIEYRFLLDKNSFLFAFFDQAWYENKSSKFVTDTPYGIGAGFAFGTAIGNFSVSYALGSQQGKAIQFRDGKVHFGYIAYF